MNIHDGTQELRYLFWSSKQESLKETWKDCDQRNKVLDTCLLMTNQCVID